MLSVLRNNTAIFSHNLASLLVMLEDNCFNLSRNWCCDMFQAKKKKVPKHCKRINIFFIIYCFQFAFFIATASYASVKQNFKFK